MFQCADIVNTHSSIWYLSPQERGEQPWEKLKLAFKKKRKQLITDSILPLKSLLGCENVNSPNPHQGLCVGELDWHRLKVSQPEIPGSNSLAER